MRVTFDNLNPSPTGKAPTWMVAGMLLTIILLVITAIATVNLYLRYNAVMQMHDELLAQRMTRVETVVTPADTPTDDDTPADNNAADDDAVVIAEAAGMSALEARTERALAEAEQAIDMAFNLLGLFEALGLVVTVGGVVLAAYGFSNFNRAKEELNRTRNQVLNEIETYRQGFNDEVQRREADLQSLRETVMESAEAERQNTSNALLANALIPLGERQYRTSDYAGALATYNRALELDPQNPAINQRLGYVYTQIGNLDQAEHHYQQALERERNFAPALAGQGYVKRRIGEQIERQLTQTEDQDQRRQQRIDRDLYFNKAEELLLQALELSPRLVDDDGESWWGVLGGLYKRRGQIEQAIEAYEEATKVTPQSSYGPVNLALLYMKQNRRDDMIEMYRKVEKIASQEASAEQGNFWGYADLIVSSFAIGKIEQAQEALPMAISIAPYDSSFMLESLASTLEELLNVMDDPERTTIQTAIAEIYAELERRAAT